jgi:hypothetical protein
VRSSSCWDTIRSQLRRPGVAGGWVFADVFAGGLTFAELQGQTSAAVINEMRDSLIDNYA